MSDFANAAKTTASTSPVCDHEDEDDGGLSAGSVRPSSGDK